MLTPGSCDSSFYTVRAQLERFRRNFFAFLLTQQKAPADRRPKGLFFVHIVMSYTVLLTIAWPQI
jgi:hypothetical protein